MGAMSQVAKTHEILFCTVIKIIRHFEKLRVASKIAPQPVANLAPNSLEIYSHSVFNNRTVQQRIHIAFAQ